MTSPGTPELVTFGETMGLLWSPVIGPLRHASTLHVTLGGAESNLAIGAARLGRSVAWAGRVGDDELGRRILAVLRGEGVDVTAAGTDPGAPTGLMLKTQRLQGSTEVAYYRHGSAASRLRPDHLDADLIAEAHVLHVTGITAGLSGSSRDAVIAACEIARASDTLISFDPNHRAGLWSADAATPVYRELAGRADVLLVAEDEGRMLAPDAGADGEHLARALARLGPAQVVVKQGAAGAVAVVDDRAVHVSPYRVQVVDPVGAGDAFDAGYLVGLIEGRTVADRLDLGSRLGAMAVSVHGDWEGLPRPDELSLVDDGRDDVTR